MATENGTLGAAVLQGQAGALSLDKGHQNCTVYLCSTCRKMARKSRRTYQRVISGLKVGGQFKFITLTTSEQSWKSGKDIQESWRALKERMVRRGLISGYVKVKEFTKRGLPHLHIIVRGPWIPQQWLSQAWMDLHSSPIVDVRRIKGKGGAAAYLSKYLGKDARSKCSWGWSWVWKGFVKDWRQHVSDGLIEGYSMLDIIAMWDAILVLYGERERWKRAGGVPVSRLTERQIQHLKSLGA